MATRLVDQHRDDGTGHCLTCSSGAQTGRYAHPCNILLATREAIRRLAELDTTRHRKATPDPAVAS